MSLTVSQLKGFMQQGTYGFPVSRNWDGWCQALVGWSYHIISGGEEAWYPTAKAAWDASPAAVSMDPYAAPLGALHWFTADHPDYDVKISLGGGRVLHAYRAPFEVPWDGLTGIGEDSWEAAANRVPRDWMRRTYLGWTYGYGPGGRFTLDLTAPAPKPNDRTISAAGARARTDKNTSSGIPFIAPVGTTYTVHRWERGESVDENDVWFLVTAPNGGLAWIWSGNFTDPSTTGIIDGNPAPPEPEPEPTPEPEPEPEPTPEPTPEPEPEPEPNLPHVPGWVGLVVGVILTVGAFIWGIVNIWLP